MPSVKDIPQSNKQTNNPTKTRENEWKEDELQHLNHAFPASLSPTSNHWCPLGGAVIRSFRIQKEL